ncbi:uncharacterized protein [Coffea arabica]|uniref:DUF674 domain-containing protein n=1 Tax=Coffea arabica TaxID=13443 RepID=A0ABM4X0T4_COFAR
MSYVAPPGVVKEQSREGGEGGGFVKGLVTYMVMDDLEVKPLSSVSSIALFDKFNVKEVGALEEKVVNLGMNEALDLLKTSLESKKVLTDVFLIGKNFHENSTLLNENMEMVRIMTVISSFRNIISASTVQLHIPHFTLSIGLLLIDKALISMAAAASSSVSLKLLIDTKSRKVLFAEANKSTVDFLFHVLSLPVGTVIRLLGKQGMVGCLANLYESIESLNETYIQPNQSKDTLLKPRAPSSAAASIPLLSLNDGATGTVFYRCGHGHDCNFASDDPKAICPRCKNAMTIRMTYVAPPAAQEASAGDEGGFVKGVVTYMVMDDLVVQPMSTISSIALLNRFNVKEVGALEEKFVNLGMNEALMLLQASLESKTVLTNVFLKNMGK